MSNVLVTGSSRGLGLELVKQIAAHQDLQGGVVVATARTCSPQLKEVISASNEAVVFVALDVADEGAIANLVEQVKSALGGRSLDILINCAGVHSETHGKVTLICPECWLKSDMGGQDADLTVPQGAEAVLKMALAADSQDNGTFKNIHVPGWGKYDGQNVAWPPSPDAVSTTSDEGSNYHAIQAKNIIQIDLQNPRLISREQQSVLKSALQLVSSMADHQPPPSLEEENHLHDCPSTVAEVPPRELLFMLLPGPPESVRIQWPDHISDKAYVRMATPLLKDRSQLDAKTFHQYCVCIYVKAIFHIYQVSRSIDDPVLRKEMSESRSNYVAAAMRSIEKFNILKPPDLLTIQSMVSSALLMQHLGRPHQCWLFISYAARQITALNYHKIRRLPATSETEQEINSVVYWCYYLDQTLSSLLCRPSSLPDLEVSPTDLIALAPSSPYNDLLRVIIDLAQIQGKLRAVSCGSRNKHPDQALETCQRLEAKMQAILPRLQAGRDSHPQMVQYDWVGVDFCYYAIFVEIHRTRLKSAFSPKVHRECLINARKSLQAFHFLQQHPAELPGFDDPYPSFLTCAFFVVFCNIIGTIDRDDYDLMDRIIQRLEPFKQDRHLGKLLNLLQSLERLCAPFFQISGGRGDSGSEAVAPDGDLPVPLAGTNFDHAHNTASLETFHPIFPEAPGLEPMPTATTDVDSSADWLMWQLFNSQVPAGWLDKDVDPFDVGPT
ncbi:hypothetical protein BO99DRAFT_420552 [Aspergillus violaceofuscus CBS 115571]|uniref:Xylanolytic transcriptional activator regulatory domain-containing protein n=1 Tax=Aspergillus violaceofuscus (strain CBS 115571) TaxID=1450538 RepID=A0A2V5HJN4_ASPV1|nr:hypothetical protein BO99DRAFT_420552 [Aspergillus violaceofuscus CBS 115571]